MFKNHQCWTFPARKFLPRAEARTGTRKARRIIKRIHTRKSRRFLARDLQKIISGQS